MKVVDKGRNNTRGEWKREGEGRELGGVEGSREKGMKKEKKGQREGLLP